MGAADQPDNSERGAHLVGKRYDMKVEQRITVTGKLRVIEHAPAFVGCVLVQGTEIRVEEGK